MKPEAPQNPEPPKAPTLGRCLSTKLSVKPMLGTDYVSCLDKIVQNHSLRIVVTRS